MFAFLADLHLGARVSNEDQMNSLKMFLSLIKKHKEPCHCIFVCGDVFDHRLSIPEAEFAAKYLLRLVYNCLGDHGRSIPVHFIHGTFTHDYDQYNIYLPLLNEIDGVSIFYTDKVCCHQLWSGGPNVLYLPQEYGNIDYSSAFSKSYDIIIGHGPISSCTMNPCKSKSEEIVHSVEKLGDLSKICIFGHYHGFTDFGNHVYYAGPLLQWKYGEDIPKRFVFCNDQYQLETVLNPYAMEFKTIDIYQPEELRNALSKEIKSPHRFMIHSDMYSLSTYHGIMATTKKNSYISYRIISDIEHTVKPTSESTTPQHTIIEPVAGLIQYIEERYQLNAEKEVREYEDKIRKEEKK